MLEKETKEQTEAGWTPVQVFGFLVLFGFFFFSGQAQVFTLLNRIILGFLDFKNHKFRLMNQHTCLTSHVFKYMPKLILPVEAMCWADYTLKKVSKPNRWSRYACEDWKFSNSDSLRYKNMQIDVSGDNKICLMSLEIKSGMLGQSCQFLVIHSVQ